MAISPTAVALLLTLGAAALSDASAAGRRHYGGGVTIAVPSLRTLADPHVAQTRSERLLSSLVHAGLFRPDGEGGVTPELAVDLGRFEGDRLIVQVSPYARFHDGNPVTASDVVQSLRRVARLGEQCPISGLAAALEVKAVGAEVVSIRAPDGAVQAEVRALLARPEAAILRGGQARPSRGAGPFVVHRRGDKVQLTAFDRYALGRPFLDRVDIRRVATVTEAQSAFQFGEVDVTVTGGREVARVGQAAGTGYASVIAMFHPRSRGAAGRSLRRVVTRVARRERLARFVSDRATPAERPWPIPISPTRASAPASQQDAHIEDLVIAFPEADTELGDLARALRDALRPMTSGVARATPSPALDVERARAAVDPGWDIALVRHEWASLTRSQAAFEASERFGIDGLSASATLKRATGRWAGKVTKDAALVPLLHLSRPARVRPPLRVGPVAGGIPDISNAHRTP